MHILHRRPFFRGMVLGCAALVSICCRVAVADGWKDRLLSEAPPKWAALERFYSKMEVSFREIVTVPPEDPFRIPGSFLGTTTCDTRQSGELYVAVIRSSGQRGEEKVESTVVRGVNSRYGFQLGKTAPDAKQFILVKMEPASDEMRGKLWGDAGRHFLYAFTVLGVRLSDLIKYPGFTIKEVRGVQYNGKEMVQLTYDRQYPPEAKVSGPEQGTVILDPEQYWCVQEFRYDNPLRKGVETVEYAGAIDGFHIIQRCTHKTTNKQYGSLIFTMEYDKVTPRDIPESEFTLSAFGLPDIPLPSEQKPPTLWRWLIGIGIGLGAIAFLFRRLWKRRQIPQSA